MNPDDTQMTMSELAFCGGLVAFGFLLGAIIFDAPIGISVAACAVTVMAMLASRQHP